MSADSPSPTKYTYRDVRHIVRLGGLLVIGFSLSIAARYAAVPETYYDKGRYRAAAPDKIASSTPRFAGQEACTDCHSDKAETLTSHKHKTLHCETCHWASREHAEDPDVEPRMKVKAAGMRAYCATCHERVTGRPAAHPQINPADHYPDQPCSECHQPHEPDVN